MPQPRVGVARLVGSLGRWAKANRPVLVMVAAYTVALGTVSTYRYFTGQTYAWDMGIMQQSLYSMAFHGRFFYYTPELFNKNPSGSFFGVHFSLLMFPLAAFYRVLPSAPALLYLQAFVVSLAAVPLVRVCRALNCPHPNLFAVLYLLSPLTLLSNLFDFHLEAFVPLGVFLLLLALLKGNRAWTVVGAVYLLSVYEYGALFVIACLGIYALLRYRELLALVRRPHSATAAQRRALTFGLALAISSVVFYFLAFSAIYAVNPATRILNGGFSPSQLSVSLANVGATGPWALLLYFGLPFVILAFLPARDPRPLLLVALFAIPALFSYTSYYHYGIQYGFLIVPGYILAAALGYRRLERAPGARGPRRFLRPTMVASSVTSVVVIVVLSSCAGYSGWFGTGAIMTGETPWNAATYQLVGTIPAGASVLVDDNAFPWVANNLNAYVIPLNISPSPVSYFDTMNSTLHTDAEYILLNTVEFGLFPYFQNLSAFVASNYGPVAEDYGVVLLQWHYTGPMTFYHGYGETFAAGDFAAKSVGSGSTYYWAGPFTTTIVGNYSATVDYAANSSASVNVEITAFDGTVVLGSSAVAVHATPPGSSSSFTVDFRSPNLYDGVEVLAHATPGLALSATGATISQLGP